MGPSNAIFKPFEIGGLALKNRLVCLPVYTGYAHTDGSVSRMMVDNYERLAASGVAMVTVANAAVSADGVVAKHNLRVDRDEFIPGLKRLATAIQKHRTLACLQLNHGGRFSATEKPLLPSPIDGSNLSFNVASLKNFMTFFPLEKRFRLTGNFLNQTGKWRRSMTAADVARVIVDFGAAAVRACRAGFDMVEIHGANGYLICQFLSKFTHRCEGVGRQNFHRRNAIPLAVVREVKRQVPQGFPVGFRLLLEEWVPDGIDLTEALQTAQMLQAEGVAYFSASAGTYNSIFSREVIRRMGRTAYLSSEVDRLKRSVETPTIISGRITEPKTADRLIRDGVTDLIGLGRPLRTDPKWVEKARSGAAGITRCINCNACLKQVVMDRGFVCLQWPKIEQTRTDIEHKLLSRSDKGFWVITGFEDTTLFRAALPQLLPEDHGLPTTIAFFETTGKPHSAAWDRDGFVGWCTRQWPSQNFDAKLFPSEAVQERGGLSRTVQTAVDAGGYGMVVMARESHQVWQERILYRARGKTTVLLGRSGHVGRVLVAIDLSDTTLLVLSMLHRIYPKDDGIRFRFVHVVRDQTVSAGKRWRDLMAHAGFGREHPLQVIESRRPVVESILSLVEAESIGHVVMGKRGLSGIKRRMLGSVSMGVLKGLTDQTLTLID